MDHLNFVSFWIKRAKILSICCYYNIFYDGISKIVSSNPENVFFAYKSAELTNPIYPMIK